MYIQASQEKDKMPLIGLDRALSQNDRLQEGDIPPLEQAQPRSMYLYVLYDIGERPQSDAPEIKTANDGAGRSKYAVRGTKVLRTPYVA